MKDDIARFALLQNLEYVIKVVRPTFLQKLVRCFKEACRQLSFISFMTITFIGWCFENSRGYMPSHKPIHLTVKLSSRETGPTCRSLNLTSCCAKLFGLPTWSVFLKPLNFSPSLRPAYSLQAFCESWWHRGRFTQPKSNVWIFGISQIKF